MHLYWRLHYDDLREQPIPMLADIKREQAEACGVENEGWRATTFIADPGGVIHFAAVNDGPAEVLRVLDALRTDALCPCK